MPCMKDRPSCSFLSFLRLLSKADFRGDFFQKLGVGSNELIFDMVFQAHGPNSCHELFSIEVKKNCKSSYTFDIFLYIQGDTLLNTYSWVPK